MGGVNPSEAHNLVTEQVFQGRFREAFRLGFRHVNYQGNRRARARGRSEQTNAARLDHPTQSLRRQHPRPVVAQDKSCAVIGDEPGPEGDKLKRKARLAAA